MCELYFSGGGGGCFEVILLAGWLAEGWQGRRSSPVGGFFIIAFATSKIWI